jgi:hypothetical protein
VQAVPSCRPQPPRHRLHDGMSRLLNRPGPPSRSLHIILPLLWTCSFLIGFNLHPRDYIATMAFSIFAMPASSLILLLSAAFRASNALPWAGPAPTQVYKADEWSPRPTNIPANPLELFRRDWVDVAVCGWIGAQSDNPAVCPSGSSCIHDTAHGSPGYIGCCTTSGSCTAGLYTSCVDKNSPGGQSGPLVENNGIFTWCAYLVLQMRRKLLTFY